MRVPAAVWLCRRVQVAESERRTTCQDAVPIAELVKRVELVGCSVLAVGLRCMLLYKCAAVGGGA